MGSVGETENLLLQFTLPGYDNTIRAAGQALKELEECKRIAEASRKAFQNTIGPLISELARSVEETIKEVEKGKSHRNTEFTRMEAEELRKIAMAQASRARVEADEKVRLAQDAAALEVDLAVKEKNAAEKQLEDEKRATQIAKEELGNLQSRIDETRRAHDEAFSKKDAELERERRRAIQLQQEVDELRAAQQQDTLPSPVAAPNTPSPAAAPKTPSPAAAPSGRLSGKSTASGGKTSESTMPQRQQ